MNLGKIIFSDWHNIFTVELTEMQKFVLNMRKIILLVLLLAISFSCLGAVPLDITSDWKPSADIRKNESGFWEITTSDKNSRININIPSGKEFDSSREYILSFDYFAPNGVNHLSLFYGPDLKDSLKLGKLFGSEAWVNKAISLKELKGWSNKMHRFGLDMGGEKNIRLQIRNICLRAPTKQELESERQRLMDPNADSRLVNKISEYLKLQNYSAWIEDVTVTKSQVKITGKVKSSSDSYQIGEVGLEVNWANKKELRNIYKLPLSSQKFTITLPRYNENETTDRIFSRWCVLNSDGVPVSSLKWATDVSSAACRKLTRPKAKSIKGMAGVTWRGEKQMEELVELGIKHVTVNIVLDHIFNLKEPPGTHPVTINNKKYFVNTHILGELDRVITFCTKHKMAVSGIIMMSREIADPEKKRLFVHPDCSNPGIYSISNLTSAEGVSAWLDMYKFIAERYTREDTKYGRVVNWICHNEIDAGQVWTNCGDKPPLIYLELYHRAMRMLYYAVRRYDPTARVFISLTHFWQQKNFHTSMGASPKEMLEQLADFCRIEGDFEWGVAYHPYPEDLFNPASWKDKRVNFTLNSPLVTFKNLEVLDAFMDQEKMRYLGKKSRSFLFSEQGFHTPSGKNGEILQAAGMVYGWYRMKSLRNLEAFHYHRWVDHTLEGGLMLGLRHNLKGTSNSPGPEKKIYAVYKAFDTSKEKRESHFALRVIGVKSLKSLTKEKKVTVP